MAGNRNGGLKTMNTIYERYGKDHYKRIGSIGRRNGRTGGFACEKVGADGLTGPERARVAGVKGGSNLDAVRQRRRL